MTGWGVWAYLGGRCKLAALFLAVGLLCSPGPAAAAPGPAGPSTPVPAGPTMPVPGDDAGPDAPAVDPLPVEQAGPPAPAGSREPGEEGGSLVPPERTLCVGIRQDAVQVRVVCPGGVTVQGEGDAPLIEGATAVEVCRRGTPPLLTVVVPAAGAAPELAIPVPESPLRVRPAAGGSVLECAGLRYRGALLIQPGKRGLGVVNVLAVDDYLRGVVPSEMSPSAPIEALKAQAVAARTYALACLGAHRADGFDLCASTHCQAYRGASGESPATDRAVAATAGRVLYYNERPITAYFHACCGGATGGAGSADPYLAGSPDAAPGVGADVGSEAGMLALAAGAPDVFCSASPAFFWQCVRTREDLAGTFARTLPLLLKKDVTLGELKSVTVSERAPSGRAAAVAIEGSGGTYTVRGESIRRLFDSGRLDAPALRSTRFVIRPIQEGDAQEGLPSSYRIFGFGWGHGLGLCQDGAVGMARRGYTYEQILGHYYPGARLE